MAIQRLKDKKPGTAAERPKSRLADGYGSATRVVSAGEALDHDLNGANPIGRRPTNVAKLSKRTFRMPQDLDLALDRELNQYNLKVKSKDEKLVMDRLGRIMATHFLESDPQAILRRFFERVE